MWNLNKVVLALVVAGANFQVMFGIGCFECNSASNFTCTEFWDPTIAVTEKFLTNCAHVYNAQYCVKMNGIFDGKLGTKRFCSSKNWGDYCEYIQRPGDTQQYRSCVLTCSTYGCNPAVSLTQFSHTLWFSVVTASVSVLRYSTSMVLQ
ncbi:hypothetical protein TCAL_14767 [Tigriopus californicus]|uniref:Protein sleepless n=1 Tax=Tigriopus californicus TaxID=6832 RepID=A0A553PGI9_TIGCA|nr:hypothetical protein TCAL_14767 [Tigriopus californicus]